MSDLFGFLVVGGGVALLTIWLSRRLALNPAYPGITLLVGIPAGIVFHHSGSPFYQSPNDGNGYQLEALALLSGTINIYDVTLGSCHPDTKIIWPAIIALLFSIFGQSQLAVIVLNAGFLALTHLITLHSVQKLGATLGQRVVSLLFWANPTLFFFGASMLREALFWLGLSLVVNSAIRISSEPRMAFVVGVTGLFLSSFIRPNLGLLFCLVALPALAFSLRNALRRKRKKLSYWPVPLTILGLLGLVPFYVNSFVRNIWCTSSSSPLSDIVDMAGAVVNTVGASRGSLANATTSFVDPNVASYKGFSYLWDGIFHFLFGAFPWEWSPTIVGLFYVASTVPWLLTITLVAIALLRWRRVAGVLLVMPATIAMAAAVAVMVTNYGALFRFRLSIWILILPAATIGAERVAKILEEKVMPLAIEILRKGDFRRRQT